jgi:hypothetical protein
MKPSQQVADDRQGMPSPSQDGRAGAPAGVLHAEKVTAQATTMRLGSVVDLNGNPFEVPDFYPPPALPFRHSLVRIRHRRGASGMSWPPRRTRL